MTALPAQRRKSVALRFGANGASFRFHLRHGSIVATLLALVIIVAVADLSMGLYRTSWMAAIELFHGIGEEKLQMVVLEWRLPRVLAAVIFGAALGASGAIFQSLARNPLGSPDVIGVDAGAFTGLLLATLFLGASPAGAFAGAASGGLVAAFIVIILSRGTTGPRFVLTGVGIGLALTAVNTWLLSISPLELAMSAAIWGAGSLYTIEMSDLTPLSVVLLVLLATAFVSQRPARILELGPDMARSLGIGVASLRLLLAVVAGMMSITVTAAAGPIAFVALAAPQLARMLHGSRSLSLAGAAAMGALLLAGADLMAANLFSPTRLPVGVVTLICGGAYMLWLLASQKRAPKGPGL